MRPQRPHGKAIVVMMVLIALPPLGCSKDELNQLVDKAKNAATQGTETVKQAVSDTQGAMQDASGELQEQLNMAGSIELTAGQPLKTKACYVKFLPQGSGRSAILQLQSYRDAESESFPSVFLQAQTSANSLEELLAEGVVRARLFAQAEAGGAVLFSETGSPVELKIAAFENEVIVGELVKATLRDSTTGQEVIATGKFTGVLWQ